MRCEHPLVFPGLSGIFQDCGKCGIVDHTIVPWIFRETKKQKVSPLS